MPRVAVVGHVEWAEFVRVERIPEAGEIVHALAGWEEPGGGGAVAAVQLAKLAGECVFFTALADTRLGRRAAAELSALGVRVEAAWRSGTQRRVFVHVDAMGERTITVIGERIAPHGADALPWSDLAAVDAVYFTAGDAEAARRARTARIVTATPRALAALAESRIRLDALIGSATDSGETFRPGDLDPPPDVVVQTEGARGGVHRRADGRSGRWAAASLPGPRVDSYGAGDNFAAGLTFGLGCGLALEPALAVGARCGAASVTGRGPYTAQLRGAEALARVG